MTTIYVANIIKKDEKYLLVLEGKGENKGKWHLPAGHLEPGESLKQGAAREAKEESGLDVEPEEIICILHRIEADAIVFHYKSEILGGELRKSEEHPDQGYYSIEEIEELNVKGLLRAPKVLDFLKKYENGVDLVITD